jgi:hypothetical protein
MWQMRFGLIGLALSAAACGASHRSVEGPTPEPNSAGASRPAIEEEGVPVQINNQNFSDMNIYVVDGGQQWLLGQVGGLLKGTLTIPAGVARGDARLRLLAAPIGERKPITTPLLVVPPGQTVYWTIGSDQTSSTVSTG